MLKNNIDDETNVQNCTLLFVDREESLLTVTEGYFQRKGYNVYSAKNKDAAKKIIVKNKINICIIDISMKAKENLELLDYLNRNYGEIFIIVMADSTSYFRDNAMTLSMLPNVNDWYIKPINLEQLEVNIIRAQNYQRQNLANLESVIIRSIEFSPEYQQAGMSILNYFSQILYQKYPNESVKVNIEQAGRKITMAIKTLDGRKELIEKELNMKNVYHP